MLRGWGDVQYEDCKEIVVREPSVRSQCAPKRKRAGGEMAQRGKKRETHDLNSTSASTQGRRKALRFQGSTEMSSDLCTIPWPRYSHACIMYTHNNN